MKILLVEDDTALRGALEELLAREGYEVIKTSNVRTAQDAMNSDIDLAMLDVGLQDGDGVSLCRQWRSEGVQTPILFLTAKDKVRLLPALNIPMDDLCKALDILKEVCAE